MIKIDKIGFAVDSLIKFEEPFFKNEKFVRWGANNHFINFLYETLDMSPIHNACVRSKVDNSVGGGFTNDYRINSKDTLNDISRQLFFEFIVSGNLFLEVIWREDRSEGISGFHIIPSKYMRVGRPDLPGFPADKYYYSRDWNMWKKEGIVEFVTFDPKDFTNRQIVHIRAYQPGYDYYGAPDYLSVCNDIRLNHEITVYNLANLVNGGNPSMWVHFNQPAPDSQYEQEQILRDVETRFRGSNNAGRILISYGEASEKPDITQISSNLQQGFYSEVFDLVQRQILSGHKIPDGSLIGLPAAGGFTSQADTLNTAYALFMRTSIFPLQNFMLRELKPLIELIYPGQEIDLTIKQNQSLPTLMKQDNV